MGQSLDVLQSCEGSCKDGRRKANGKWADDDQENAGGAVGSNPVGCSGWADEEIGIGCHALQEGLKSAVASANRGGVRVSDTVLLNHELLQYARQGNLKGLSSALERGAWTETRRPLVMKPQKPETGGKGKSKGRDLEQPDIGMTALMFAAQAGSPDCVRRLLWAGALVNSVEEDGWSPLHFAAKEGNFEVCVALLNGGACSDALTQDGKTPLQVALDDEDCGPTFAHKLRSFLEARRVARTSPEADVAEGVADVEGGAATCTGA